TIGDFSLDVYYKQNYPKYAKGVRVTVLETNIADTIFSSSGIDVTLTGHLVNKTTPGVAWFYVFESQNHTSSTGIKIMPSWIKRTAGLWSNGKITNANFHDTIEYFIQEGMVPYSENSTGKIPQWFKKNAGWWYEGLI